MKKIKRIICAFCRGSGRHPFYFRPPCPVCKGKGENEVVGEVQTCKHCKGNGRKSTTTLTCYYCGGLGVVAGKDHSGRVHSATPGVEPEASLVDKNTIREVVEETIKKYQLGTLKRGVSSLLKKGTTAIKRIPVGGLLREEKEMKAYVEPISGTRIESAKAVDQSVASLTKLREKPKPTTLSEEKGDIKKSFEMLARIKKERR